MKQPGVLNKRLYNIIDKMADAIIPSGGSFNSGAADVNVAEKLGEYIDRMGAVQFFLVKVIFYLFEYLPLITQFKRLTKMSTEERINYLKGWETSWFYYKRFLLMLPPRILIMMVFYKEKEVGEEIGYNPVPIDGREGTNLPTA